MLGLLLLVTGAFGQSDPGHVTARRLNRAEYTNTIRDLLAVDFRAQKNFPTDDLGNGFDNIGDVLTVSPVLMEKYLEAAEEISKRALGADPLPAKPLEIQLATRDRTARRLGPDLLEGQTHLDFDGDYTIRIGLPGERDANAAPVTLGFWMDGKLLHSQRAETKPSTLIYFDPYSDETMRLYIPAGDHVFRAGFIGDDFPATLDTKDLYNRKKNKFPDTITLTGPFASQVERASRKKILICDPNSGAACVNWILATLARRAYRRPVTPGEVAELQKFVDEAKADGQTTEQGLQLAIEALLVSPNFLFRLEHDAHPTDVKRAHPVSDVELASRLSYFLWSSMPDDELMALAEAGRLRPALRPQQTKDRFAGGPVLDAQVKRMLADGRSDALAENFAGQWLELRNLDVVRPDPVKFPEWNPELRDEMKTETRLFFDFILRDNRPLEEFLDARYTFLNERLARFYNIFDVKGPEFRKVELKTPERGGLLGQASVLTVSSYPSRTSVVLRGKYILDNILNDPPPPPPPDVPALNEAAVGTEMSLRQQMETHRSEPMCAACHAKMDPLGFGLENYNGIGRWRTMDGKFPVDASGTLPGGRHFSTPAEMRALLVSQLPQFAQAVTEKMLTYALGRGLKPEDRDAVGSITARWAAQNYAFQDLIFEVARSFPFQERRGEPLPAKDTVSGDAARFRNPVTRSCCDAGETARVERGAAK